MDDDFLKDGGGSEGGGEDDRAPWPLPELRVMIERLEGRMSTMKAENQHEMERLGNRLTKTIMGATGLILAGFGVTIALVSFMLTRSN